MSWANYSEWMPAIRTLPPEFYRRSTVAIARDLLGRHLVRTLPEGRVVARLVEVEAYAGPHDRASHAYRGRRTPRNESMFLSGGHAYVYRIYGIHRCLNVVAGEAGEGLAVLLRGAEILEGEELVRARRPGEERAARLLSGPGNLCRGLSVDMELDATRFDDGALRLAPGEPVTDAEVATGPRVGCESAGEAAAWPLRFVVAGSAAVSYPRASLRAGFSACRAADDPPSRASRPRSGRRAGSSS